MFLELLNDVAKVIGMVTEASKSALRGMLVASLPDFILADIRPRGSGPLVRDVVCLEYSVPLRHSLIYPGLYQPC